MPPQACANYAMGPLQVRFSFKVEPPSDLLIFVGVCCCVCFLLSGAMLDAILTNGSSTVGFCTTAAVGAYPGQAYMHPGDGHWPTPGMH